jgi:HD superfamily phosphohydrolase
VRGRAKDDKDKGVAEGDKSTPLVEMVNEVEFPIHDPVHNRVWLTAQELEVVDTPAFQRLRRVSQLGLADFVFPGATRTRFSHSLGALYVMGELLKADRGEIANHLRSYDIDWRALRFAALLHDVGHLPFSHPMERVYQHLEYEHAAAFDLPDAPNALLDRAAASSSAEGASEDKIPASHEALAQYVLDNDAAVRKPLLAISPEMPTLVGQLIRGLPTLTAVATALISSDLDADRLDFVLRDSHSAGLVYGLVDLDYLIENVKIGYADGLPVFAIDAKHGIGPLEHYLLARSFIYAQLVHHKTVAAAELLLRAVLLGAADSAVLPSRASDVAEWFKRGELHRLTDGYVWSILGECVHSGKHPETGAELPAEFLSLARRLINRQLPKVAWSETLLVRPGDGPPREVLLEHFLSDEKKKHLADISTSKANGVTIRPSDIALLERREDVVKAYREPERVGKHVRPPRGALVAKDHPEQPPATPLTTELSSFLAPAAEMERVYRYVFVLEDEGTPLKQKPKAKAVLAALSSLGLLADK